MNASDPVFAPQTQRPFILVFANEKGGTGKSTLSFHAIVSLLKCGYRVGSIDADVRQGTLSRYLENRAATADMHRTPLQLPDHVLLGRSGPQDEPSLTNEASSESVTETPCSCNMCPRATVAQFCFTWPFLRPAVTRLFNSDFVSTRLECR